MPGSLGVHDQHVGTRGLKFGKIVFGLHNHQMHIKKQAAALSQLPDDVLPEGNVRHKPPVHDIPVHPPETGGLQSRKLRRMSSALAWAFPSPDSAHSRLRTRLAPSMVIPCSCSKVRMRRSTTRSASEYNLWPFGVRKGRSCSNSVSQKRNT